MYKELRRAPRVEVSGGVTTRLVATGRRVQLRDIGHGGFQIESPVPIAAGTVHRVEFTTSEGWQTTLTARSAHCRGTRSPGAASTFAVGFAFVFTPADRTELAVGHLIDRITAVLSFD